MVFGAFTSDEELDKDKEKEGSEPLQNQSVSGQSSTTDTSAPATAQAPAGGAKGPSSSGQFTNLQKYISANQDFAQDEGGMGGKIQSGIQKESDRVSTGVDKAKTVFDQNANSNASQWNNMGVVDQALQDPTKFAQDQSNVDAFARVRDASYDGPQSLDEVQGGENSQNLRAGVSQVNTMADSTKSEAGRFNLLQQMFGRNNYNYGQQKLDNLLVQADPTQAAAAAQANRSAALVAHRYDQAQRDAEAKAQQLTQQANDTRTQVGTKLTATEDASTQDLDNRVNAARAEREGAFSTLNQHIDSHQLTDQELQMLGLKHGDSTWGLLNPNVRGNYITPGEAAARTNVATADDYAKFSALAKLTGLSDSSVLSNTTADQAGKFFNDQNIHISPAMKAEMDRRAAQAAPLIEQDNHARNYADWDYQTKLNEMAKGMASGIPAGALTDVDGNYVHNDDGQYAVRGPDGTQWVSAVSADPTSYGYVDRGNENFGSWEGWDKHMHEMAVGSTNTKLTNDQLAAVYGKENIDYLTSMREQAYQNYARQILPQLQALGYYDKV